MSHVVAWRADDPDVAVLETAINDRYPEFRERSHASGFKDHDAEAELGCIRQTMLFYIGLEVDRRVRRSRKKRALYSIETL